MGLRINTNVSSIAAQRSVNKTNQAQESSLSKLSSGSRITKSADDAAGMAISEKMKAEIRSAKQADRNANDGISMVQVAEGGLNESQNILTRLRELAIQASSDTVGDVERSFSNMEYQNLLKEMDRISQVTEFNGKKLLDGTGDTFDFQVGTKGDENSKITYEAGQVNASISELGVEGLEVSSKEGAQSSLASVDSAIEKISGQRAFLGALQNRLASSSSNLQVNVENLSAANSRIRDVDYAEETAKQATNTILQAAGTSVLAQANMNGQNALKLIG
ncbi:MAG: flagellin FliC [Bacteriovoracaceae bacterium]|nr:flagellin FliC [Bacteriovoracaceae bacterium]